MIDVPSRYDFTDLLGGGDVLLIVPPFSHWAYGSLACHLLQACAYEQGIRVRVLYANLLLASVMGEERYKAITFDYHQLIGERLFSRAAYGSEPFGSFNFEYRNGGPPKHGQAKDPLTWSELQNLEQHIDSWVERVAAEVAHSGFRLVGATSSFQQTAASIALLNRVKQHDSEVVTFIGGANCEDEMARGILSLGSTIDFVFSGESEATFPDFAARILRGETPLSRIIEGTPCMDLDSLPVPHYAEYYDQLERALPGLCSRDRIWQAFESSRGCWWGRKSHCTFCGLNGNGMVFREKSADRVISELKQLTSNAPTNNVMTTDNILPYSYFRSVIPKLGTELPNLTIHYECKANLSLEKVIALFESGITKIQPGIEALSTTLLDRMAKGVTASKNVALLRYCRMLGMEVRWNLLCHFPGDRISEYKQTLELLPLLRHLPPPTGIFPLSIDRFSPYFDRPENYAVTNIEPDPMYATFLPQAARIDQLAYHFQATYPSESRQSPEIIEQIEQELVRWESVWNNTSQAIPSLLLQRLSDQRFVLIDTRELAGNPEVDFLNFERAQLVLCPTGDEDVDSLEWAMERKLIVRLDNVYVPLVTCEPEFMRTLESGDRSRSLGVISAQKGKLPVVDAIPVAVK